jgi:hypothetical protein
MDFAVIVKPVGIDIEMACAVISNLLPAPIIQVLMYYI